MSSEIKHIRSHTPCRCWGRSWVLADLSEFDLKQAFMKIPAGDSAVRHLSSLPGLCLISPCGMKESECMLRLFPQINLTVPDWCLQGAPGPPARPQEGAWTCTLQHGQGLLSDTLLKPFTGAGQDLGIWLGRGVKLNCEKWHSLYKSLPPPRAVLYS